jgi:hypothetical protein
MGGFNGRECLHVAQFLGGQAYGPCTLESAQRAATSRAYYAAYGHAFHHEVDNGKFTPTKDPKKKGQDHTQLRMHFHRSGESQIATELEELHIWRKRCDYEKIVIGAIPMATILGKAEHIITHLK